MIEIKIKRKECYLIKPRSREQRQSTSEGENEKEKRIKKPITSKVHDHNHTK